MKSTKSRAAKPMSSSSAMTAMATPQATRMGMSGRGSRTRRFPTRAVGMESISLLAAKYEAKKMQRRILENSIGWNSRPPTWIHSRAPLMGVKKRGETSRMPPTNRSR